MKTDFMDEIEPSAGVEVLSTGIRVRVWFPAEAWVRVQKMSKRLAIEEKTLVRVLASLQLVQLEAIYGAASDGIERAVSAQLDESAVALFADLAGDKT